MTPDKSIFIVDEVGKVVANVSAKLTPVFQALDPGIQGVHYLHGHPLEIIDTLRQRDRSKNFKFKKYPLVALFQDFSEVRPGIPGIAYRLRLHLIIAKATKPEYKSDERYTYNFKPYLYPIYQHFLVELDKHKLFMNYPGTDGIEHTKIDRLFWGREGLYANEANIFEDFLDCIEIRDLELNVYSKIC